jgi:Metallo-peptidase family M12/Secretion system C-terminal sorting domain
MNNLFAFIICLFTLISNNISGQAQSLKPSDLVAKAITSHSKESFSIFNISTNRSNPSIPKEIKSYSLLDINKSQLNALVASDVALISLVIPQEGRNDLTLELVEVHPFAENFSVKVAPSMQSIKVETGKHYRGIIKGQRSSVVALSVINGEITGFVSHPMATGNLIIGKLENDQRHILYQDDQINHLFSFDCQTQDNTVQYSKEQLRGSGTDAGRALSDCVRLYLEVDYDIYLNKGSSIPNVTSFVTGLFNQVSTLYANEQINTVVSEIVVWTVPSPYNGTSSLAMLNAFTAYRQGFNGDLAQLLSYKASGGVAYVDGLCRSNPDFSMSYAGIQSTYQNVPTYSWTVEVCTHEFGHLFGSQHTHACAWNGNNTAIDGCYTTEGGCGNPGLPSGGGTIMSYCHLTSAGINFSNGFGLQPGNVIRSEVTAASCLQACEGNGGGGNECQENALTLTLTTDDYANETTWDIKNSTGSIIYSGGPYSVSNNVHTVALCLPNGCYTFTIYDSYGDGICCQHGSGYYNITQGTTTLINGATFGSSETKSFCTSGTSNPTCTDGIQNGNETGVDCGGNCPACPTCTDGIQNGNETGIDCGGNCPACPTCNDGIQNGGETGVDCGGTCPACPTGSIQITNLAGHYYESGWDGWTSGGGDCGRYGGSLAPEGTYAIRLRDNSGTASSMTSSSFNLSTYDSVTVEFKFITGSFESNEDFWLRYYNGSTWTTIKTFKLNTDFLNNQIYTKKIKLNGPLAQNAQFRFQSDASDDSDVVYIDAVIIKGYKTIGGNNPSCTDGIQNGTETGVDCGGNCPACPTCNDGVQNGGETGIDCGGNCSACPTCNDGIQNGTETGTDCGGICTACPTCNDGIQNGSETGIDCGGNCTPCPTNGNTVITNIAGHYFETGWDGWISGGADCARYGGSRSPEGIYSIRLRDNNGESSSMTSPIYNLSTYDSVTVEFKFNAISYESGEDFWLRYYDGNTWTTVAAYVFNTNFANNQINTKKVKINGPLSANAKFRFQSDAGDATDLMYVDAVIIKGYKTVPAGLISNEEEASITLAGYYFESGWDGWFDGGDDCYRYKGNMSAEGQYSIRLRNQASEASSMTSESFDLTKYQGAEVKFQFRTEQLENGDRLRLEYFDGKSWIEAASLKYGDEFENGKVYVANIILSGPFGDDVKFRFQSQASDKDDLIYIDAVVISGMLNQTLHSINIIKSDDKPMVTNGNLSHNIKIYPNPATDVFSVSTDEEIKVIKMFNLAGQLVSSYFDTQTDKKHDISSLSKGMYLLQIETSENVYIEKFVKQ